MARTTLPSVAAPDTSIAEGAARPFIVNLLVSMRPSQWTKNLLLFAGLLFGNASVGRGLFDRESFGRALAAFLIFCALSGVVYLINDVFDRDNDRRHPLKARRPIASGAIAPATALTTAGVVAILGLAAAFALSAWFA